MSDPIVSPVAGDEAITLKHGLILTIGNDTKGRLLAIISDGSPQHGDFPVTVLDVRRVRNRKEAEAWFQTMKSKHHRPGLMQ